MDNFLIRFNEFTKNKYNYLRLKKVEFYEIDSIAKLYFVIPEDIYENGFDNSVIKELKRFCAKVSGKYKCEFFFERLVISEDIVKTHLLEILATECPFLASSINKECVSISVDEKIDVYITIEQDVYDLIDGAPFLNKIIDNLEESFGLQAYITFNLVPVGDIVIEKTESQIVSRSFVPYRSFEYLCGFNAKSANKPIFLEGIHKAMESTAICGRVSNIEKRTYEKDPNSKFKYYRYNYRMTLFDYSGTITAYFKTNDENCQLNYVKDGDQLMIQGRIAYSDRLGKFVMYSKTIYTIELDIDGIQDILRPKPAPDTLKYPSIKYEGQDFIEKKDLFNYEDNSSNTDMNCVFITYRSINKGFAPWELCMLSFKNGVPDQVYNVYIKVANVEVVDFEYRAKVLSGKRLADYVPDILCFCKNKVVYCKNADIVSKELENIAKAQHTEYKLDMQEANKLGAKNGQKFDPLFERMLKEYGIQVFGTTSYDYAIAMAQLYLKVKK